MLRSFGRARRALVAAKPHRTCCPIATISSNQVPKAINKSLFATSATSPVSKEVDSTVPHRRDQGGLTTSSRTFGAKTKIVCTIGPASEDSLSLRRMAAAGMDVARLNFSHGTHAEHAEVFQRVRELAPEYQISTLCDIQGPKIRVGPVNGQVVARVDDLILVTDQDIEGGGGVPAAGGPARIQIKLPGLCDSLLPGDPIFINDGIVKLIAVERQQPEGDWVCKVDSGGVVSSNKGCNVPNAPLQVDVLTDKDRADLEFIATKLRPDFVAVSFVGTAADVLAVRAFLSKFPNGASIRLLPKIERKMALDNLQAIINVSDGIMLARGDLGVEVEGSDVPYWQKFVTKLCNQMSIPVIVATQMLESMTHSQRPTRAETTDVYNAVLDGADAVMLSGETSVGAWPVHTVGVMDEIVRKAERNFERRNAREYMFEGGLTQTTGLAVYELCRSLSQEAGLKGKILALSDADDAGFIARQVTKFRPEWDVIVVTNDAPTARVMNLLWGVTTLCQENAAGLADPNLEGRVLAAIKSCVAEGLLMEHETAIVVSRSLLGRRVGVSVTTLSVGAALVPSSTDFQ